MRAAFSRFDAALLGGICAIAAVLRWPGIARADDLVFDETFYVNDARRYLGDLDGAEVSWVHPPLGKWFVAGGIEVFGDNPDGWRAAVFVAGVLTVALTFLVGRWLLGTVAGAAAAVFVTFDGLAIVQSRTAMLDSFLPPLLLGAVLVLLPVLVLDQSVVARSSDDDVPAPIDPADDVDALELRPHALRLGVAGALLGAAVAVKWAAAPVLAAVGVIVVVRLRPRSAVAVAKLVGGLVVVPAGVYALSYARFWSAEGLDVAAFVRVHRWMLEFHQNLTVTHPYGSEASSWLLLRRPVSYAYESEGGQVSEVLALGNPALWWGFLLSLPWLVYRWWQDRQPIVEIVVVALVTLYVPWLVTFRQGFLFYLTPLVPFMALGLTWALCELWSSERPWRWAALTGPPLVVAVGLVYLPLWIGSPVSRGRWERLMLFDSWI